MWEFAALLLLALAAGWLWSGMVARERATAAARRACERYDQQLLDETVEQVGLSLARSVSGTLSPRRIYRFEFTSDGMVRRSGELAIHGGRVVDLHLALEEFTLYEQGQPPKG
ncbi:MAG TPA: DUF3301 domain-containing protein, partial [Gammaproteobacteria bacterium]